MTIIEITKLHDVIMFNFQRALGGSTARPSSPRSGSPPVFSFSRLWNMTSNASARMQELGIPHSERERKLFSRCLFESIDLLVRMRLCEKQTDANDRLLSLALTPLGRERLATITFAAQERAREPEMIWNTRALKRYRGPIV